MLCMFFCINSKTTHAQNLDANQIIEKSSQVSKESQSIKYYVKSYIFDNKDTITFNSTIILSKDLAIKHPIFSGYRFNMNVQISGKYESEIEVAYDGQNLELIKDSELTILRNPNGPTTMRKLNLDLYMLILKGFINPDGFNFLLKRNLERIDDKIINGVDSYTIKATNSFPISPGSNKLRESITYWYFNKKTYLPTAYIQGNRKFEITILEKNYKQKPSDFTLSKTNYSHQQILTNEDVEKENLIAKENVAPNFTFKENGIVKQLSDLKGNVVILDFWGTWCPPCIKSMPNIQQIHEKYGEDIKVIGIAVKDTKKKAKDFMVKNGYTYKLISDQDYHIANIYDVAMYPTLYIIDQNGIVKYGEKGYNANGFEVWSKIIDKILR